jgi:hypothetical protein
VARSCECGNEPPGFIKCGEYLDMLRTRYLLKKDCCMELFSFFCGEGPRSRSCGSTAALRLIVQPCDEDEEKDD